MGLSGPEQGAPALASGRWVERLDGVANDISELCGQRLRADAAGFLGQRAALVGRGRRGAVSVGGACRMVAAADGVLAVSLARTADADMDDLAELVGEHPPALGVEAVRTVVSLALVAGSAYVLVEGAERVAEALNLSGGFVGYTLVAVGTSAPELVTAAAAARQRETELLVGNLLGSNVFNSLAVGGAIGLVGPGPVGDATLQTLGSLMMVVICVVSWIAMAVGLKVSRIDGVVLLGLWVASIALLAG